MRRSYIPLALLTHQVYQTYRCDSQKVFVWGNAQQDSKQAILPSQLKPR